MDKKKKGFTLIELVVVIAIVLIFMGLVLSLFLSQNKNFTQVQDSTSLQNETRLVLTNMEDDFKVAKNRKINSGTCGTGQILYQYELKNGAVTEYYGYIYYPSEKTIKKCKLTLSSGAYTVSSVMATLTTNVKSVTVQLKKDEAPAGNSKGDIYEISLELVIKPGTQYEESNKEITRVTTRN